LIDMGEWYRRMFEDFFGEYWVKVFERKRGTDQEVSFLRELLGEGLVLDNACGAGRISIPLSCHLTVIGLDLSLYLLKRANQKAEESGIKSLYLVRGDMRYLPFKSNIFDAVISMWTSFGYFSDEENEVALRENVRVLKPGGKFILDVANPFWLIKNFMEKDWSEDEEYITLEQRSVNWREKRWGARWIIINKQTKSFNEISFDHRLYDLKELEELLTNNGLKIKQVYGSFQKEEFNENSRRMIIISQKMT